jgi:glycosyltransferase involved in cell wall biosynthesis
MKVLMVWDGDYPWDVRVEKVCRTFLEAGHDVSLVCRNSTRSARKEDCAGIQVRRVWSGPGTSKATSKMFTFPAFFSPVWLTEISKAAIDVNPDLMIIRDLPMALAALWIARIHRIPIVLDMAECYPEMLRCTWQYERFRLANVFARNPYLADLVELAVVRNVDHVWTMIEESSDRLVRKRVSPDRVTVVSNTPRSSSLTRNLRPTTETALTILYVGLLNPSRGIRTLIDAARLLKDRGRNFTVRVAGSGKDQPYLVRKIVELDLGDHIEMLGWVDHSNLMQLMLEADAGIVPHYPCAHWDNTIPNKLFDYMSAGIPVLVSDAKPAARVVRETGTGIVYRGTDPHSLADSIERLYDADLRRDLGDAGIAAVQARYSWSHDSAVMLRSAGRLIEGRSRSRTAI